MALKRISGPDTEPVSLEDMKLHLRVEDTAEDDLIPVYISAARAHVENWCHIAVSESVWELTLDAFPVGAIRLTKSPIIGVTSVKYDDGDGSEQTVDAEDYYVDAAGPFGWVVPVSTWPATLSAINAVRVRFTAGWETVPEDLRAAVMLMTGHLYENREAVAGGPVNALPLGVEALISPYLVPTVA